MIPQACYNLFLLLRGLKHLSFCRELKFHGEMSVTKERIINRFPTTPVIYFALKVTIDCRKQVRSPISFKASKNKHNSPQLLYYIHSIHKGVNVQIHKWMKMNLSTYSLKKIERNLSKSHLFLSFVVVFFLCVVVLQRVGL